MYLYIVGRRHCGSTILDVLLGNCPEVQSVGELVHVHDPSGSCSCGARVSECAFWRKVRDAIECDEECWKEMTDRAFRQAHLRNFHATWRASTDDPELRRLAEFTERLAAAIRTVSKKPHLLDSTKEVTRGLLLARFLPETRIIHMVRDPRSNVASQYWRWKKHGYFSFLRRKWRARPLGGAFMLLACLSWSIGNLLSELVARRARGDAIRVRYEDLCEDPAGEISRIGEALGIDVAPVIEGLASGRAFPVGHNVGGNRIRFQREVRFDPQREHARPPLPRWLLVSMYLLCWPLMLRYGYARRSPSGPKRVAERPA